MTTKRQIKALLAPLLKRHDDLVLIDKQLIVRPVRHVVRSVLFEGTRDADRFKITWGTSQLVATDYDMTRIWFVKYFNFDKAFSQWVREKFADCAAEPHTHGVGHAQKTYDDLERELLSDVYGSEHPNLQWSKPLSLEVLLHAIETQILPSLRNVRTLADYAATDVVGANRIPFERDWRRHYVYLVSVGQFEAALRLAREHPRLSSELSEDYKDTTVLLLLIRRLHRHLEAGDIAAVAASLHDVERQVAEAWDLTSVWEDTPFPFELQ